MRFVSASLALLLGATLAGCGGSKPVEPASADSAVSAPAADGPEASESGEVAEKSAEAPAAGGEGVPTKCFKQGSVCSPDPKFVKRLCNGKFPSIGLYLFSNPAWTRGYLTRRTQAWNASGGASDSGWVEFDEEVLILYARVADTGGMQVSGAGGSFDALRWDGSCVTLQSEEVTMSKAPAPKNPPIDFRYLDDDTQEALRKDDKVNAAWLARRKECKGASSGEVSLKCVKADADLTKTVIAFVRGGGTIPEPKKLP
ncbi:MAG TPA: hypothetical protein VEX18_05615 [Polyangiaceae bacterium]|nr:hypothetical protein [Polyangiaceae bacterium]